MATPALRIRIAPKFPTKQQAGVGLGVSRTGGVVTYRQDWSAVQDGIAPPDDVEVLVRDPSDGQFYRTTPAGLADIIRPVASQPEAEAGSNNTKTMTPLRASQHAKANIVGRSPELYGGTSAAAITAALASGGPVDLFPVAYPTTTLDNLDISKMGVVPPGARFQSVMAGDALVRDLGGELIGLSYNHREEECYSGSYPRGVPATAITTGNLVPPLRVQSSPVPGIDVGAHWYNDSGLEYQRLATGIAGPTFDGWYDWRWNHTDLGDYDPSRHPVTGWYRGDDPNVLDQQAHDLLAAGYAFAVPVTFNLDISAWGSASNRNYWLYKLLGTPNGRRLPIIFWARTANEDNSVTGGGAPAGVTTSDIIAQWQSIYYSLLPAYPNCYAPNHLGRRWFPVYCWDTEQLRKLFDTGGSSTNTAAFLAARAAEVKALGYSGLCVMAHNTTPDATMNRAALLASDVLYLPAPYGGNWASGAATTYDQLVSNYAPPASGTVLNVSTALVSRAPHPSGFNYPGSTPDKFRSWLKKAFDNIIANPEAPRWMTVYALGEWAEGGPGLIADRQYGYGYLNALREAASSFTATGAPVTIPSRDYTPTISASSGTLTSVTGALGSYRKVGKFVDFQVSFTVTTNGSASGLLQATVPFAAARQYTFIGRDNTSGAALIGILSAASSTVLMQVLTSTAYPGADGHSYAIDGTFEATT